MLIKKIFRLVFVFILLNSLVGYAQIRSVIIGIDGLHCSACSFGTEKSIRKLDFVKNVKMDLNKHLAEIEFKGDKEISLEAITKQVIDAGFSVRNMFVQFDFLNPTPIKENLCYEGNNLIFNFTSVKEQTLDKTTTLQVLGEQFMSKSEFKKWKLLLKSSCNSTVPSSKKVYHVTI